MKDEDKTKSQLINELAEARQRVAEMEASAAGRERLERESEERRLYLESVLACAPDAIVTLDARHNILEWNAGAKGLFGYSLSEVVGRNIDTLITQPDTGAFGEATGFTQQVLSGKSLLPTETVRYRKDGSPVDVIVSGSPILLGGEVGGVVAIYTDVTRRKRAEEALRASEEYARSVIENSLDTIITVDMERRIVEFNKAAQETFGYRAEEILGKHVDALYLDPQEGIDVHRTTVEQGQCLREVSALRKNSEVFPSLISASALRNARGELMGVMGISRNISERKRAEEALRQRNRELAMLNRAGHALTSTLDLDQVLATVLGEVRRLLDVTACSVWLIEPETDDLVCLQAATPQDEIVRGWRLAPGEGICGWVARYGESLVIVDAWADERYYSGVDEQTGLGLRSILTMPLRVKEDVIGVLQVLDTGVGRFDETDLELLKPLVASASIAIENARLYEEARQRVAGLEALQRTSMQLTSTLDLSAVLNTIAESSLTMTEATDCHIYLYDEASETFTFGAAFWEDGRREAAVKAPRRDGFAATVARGGRVVVINDASHHPLYATPEAQEWKLQAIAGFPLKRAELVLGVFTIAFLTAHTFSEEELRILGLLADQAAIAIENARLYEEARHDAETRATLLREVNHRVKNNLTAIIGLLYAERRYIKMEERAAYQTIMQSLVGRVQGLSTVHSMLSASEWEPLSLRELTVQVIHSSLQVLPRDKRVSVNVTPSPARVTSDQAHNLALVINELTTNSIKYSLQEQSATRIGVRIELDGNTVAFEFRDDGPGYPEEVLRLERYNVGFDLIQNIVHKSLHGELSLHNDGGAVAVIRFEIKT